MEKWRLFIALAFEEQTKARVAAFAAGLPRRIFRPLKAENLHVTVHFLGDVDADRAPLAAELLGQAARTAASGAIEIELGEAAAFPPPLRRARAVAIPVSETTGRLVALHAALGHLLTAAGFAVEQRRYRPHLTVAYLKRGARAGQIADLADRLHPTPSTAIVSRAVLIRSTLAPGGSIYRELSSSSI